jgi:hypothetical protein
MPHLSCELCIAGRYQDSDGEGDCIDCETGKFQDEEESTNCVFCSAGKHRTDELASSAEDTACVSCSSGRSSPGGSDDNTNLACDVCVAGRYQDGEGEDDCINCEGGQYQPSEEQTTCLLCNLGKFRTSEPASSEEPNACALCANRLYVQDDTCETSQEDRRAIDGTGCGWALEQDNTCTIAYCPTDNANSENDMFVRDNYCVRDGGWTPWDPWSQCFHDPLTEADGSATRERTCTKPTPLNGGNDCSGLEELDHIETRLCRNGGWTVWGTDHTPDGGCTEVCGGGEQFRACTNPVPLHGFDCDGDDVQTCNEMDCDATVECPSFTCIHVHGMIQVTHSSADHEAGHMNHHCLYNEQDGCKCFCNPVHAVDYDTAELVAHRDQRYEEDTADAHESAEAVKERVAALPTTTVAPPDAVVYVPEVIVEPSPVNGQWSDWGAWSSCILDNEWTNPNPNVNDSNGHMIRVRVCNNPAPAHDGNYCEGAESETKACDHGHFYDYSEDV